MRDIFVFTAPSGAPRNLAESNTTSTSITVTWDEIDCIDRNGMIDRYTVEYQPVGGAATTEVVTSMRTFTANDLQPFTTYTFRVRGCNNEGMGPYSNQIIILTDEDGKFATFLMIAACYFITESVYSGIS